MVPWGFRKIIQYLQDKYLGPTGTPLIISENGYAPAGEHMKRLPDVLQDNERIEYFQGYLQQMVEAVFKDGIDIRGYFAWSLLDNLEWAGGFRPTYGSVYVDRDDGCKRHIKQSGFYLREFFKRAVKRG